jgi:general secretion pathway protein F
MTGPASYSYRAARADGVLEHGVLAAESRAAAAQALIARGLFPVALTPARELALARSRLSMREQALGVRVLATLLEAGLSMSRALAALPELAPPAWQTALPQIQQAVTEGAPLGTALTRSALGLPPVVLGIIQAGEAGSGVAPAVRRAAEFLERTAATRAAIRAALAYPLLLAVAGTGAVALLVGVVLPRFGAILADLGQTLPPTTRLVLGAAMLVRAWALPSVLGLALLGVLGHAWVTRETGRAQWHAVLLTVPLVGRVRFAAATGRVAAALAALLESGVPLAAALGSTARAAGDAAISARLLTAREAIVRGERPSTALAQAAALTPTTVRLVRAGEETGRLGPMLAHAAALEQDRAEQLVKNAVRLLEPGLILAFGGLVALVAAALLQAIYSVRPT